MRTTTRLSAVAAAGAVAAVSGPGLLAFATLLAALLVDVVAVSVGPVSGVAVTWLCARHELQMRKLELSGGGGAPPAETCPKSLPVARLPSGPSGAGGAADANVESDVRRAAAGDAAAGDPDEDGFAAGDVEKRAS